MDHNIYNRTKTKQEKRLEHLNFCDKAKNELTLDPTQNSSNVKAKGSLFQTLPTFEKIQVLQHEQEQSSAERKPKGNKTKQIKQNEKDGKG